MCVALMAGLKLNRRVTFLRVDQANTALGVAVTQTPIGTMWAARSEGAASEREAGGAVESQLAARFIVQATVLARGLRPKDRLTSDGITFEITGIRPWGFAYLEILAEGQLDQ